MKDKEPRDKETGNEDCRKRKMSTIIEEGGRSCKIVRSKQFEQIPAYGITVEYNFEKGYTPKTNFSADFVQAAADGDLARVKRYFERGECLVNSPCIISGANALHMACWKGHVHVIEWLLKNGADLELCDRKGRSAIYFGVKGYIVNQWFTL